MVECCLELIAAHILLHPCLVPWLLGLSRNGARPPWGRGGGDGEQAGILLKASVRETAPCVDPTPFPATVDRCYC